MRLGCLCTRVLMDFLAKVTDLYRLLLNALLASPEKVAHGRKGYYIAESDEFSYGDLNKEIGRVLFKLGKVANAQQSILSGDETGTYGGWVSSRPRIHRMPANDVLHIKVECDWRKLPVQGGEEPLFRVETLKRHQGSA